MSVACSVCGQPVSTKDNLVIEHKTQQGKICYGSFTPASPIEFKELAVKKQRTFGYSGLSDNWDNTWISGGNDNDLNSLAGDRNLNVEYGNEDRELPQFNLWYMSDNEEQEFLKELSQMSDAPPGSG